MKQPNYLHLLPFLLWLVSTQASAQLYKDNKYLDYSNLFKRYYYKDPVRLQFGAGLAASRGDYCGSWPCNRLGIYLNAGLFATIQPGISAGVELSYFRLGAKEKSPMNDTILSFQGNNASLIGLVRINLLRDKSSFPGKIAQKSPRVLPYVTVGIGGLVYSVRSYWGQKRIEPRKPDGAAVNYPAVALLFPVGAGLAFRYNYRTAIQPELIYHFTTTDALDGAVDLLPTRKYDGYGTASVKVLYAF